MSGQARTGGGRRPRVARVGEVVRTSRLTPHMIRVVLGGEGLAGFPAGEYTDHYVKLLFPPPGAPYGVPFDPEQVRADHPQEHWPVTRTYTVRAWDADRGELTIDFVYHGDEGLAGPWAAAAAPGDRIQMFGPGGGYAPSPDADWHLLVGDESALPAIGVALTRLPAGVPALVFVEVEGRRSSSPTWSSARASRWCGCTVAVVPRGPRWSPRSRPWTCRRAVGTCSCTARPAW